MEGRQQVDRASPHSLPNRLGRALWGVVCALLFRPSPGPLYGWRRLLLRCFGARIAPDAIVHPSARIWAPWNLVMKSGATLSYDVDCYCVAPVVLEERAIVSQYSFLCTATHDYEQEGRPVRAEPITIGAGAWVCADVFVGPGVTVGEGAVVGARACVCRDVDPWTVVGGNPARVIRQRRRQGEK